MLFERTLKDDRSEILFNSKAEKISAAAKEMISVNCLKNTSFFVARNQVNVSLPLIDAAKDWLRHHLMRTIFPNMKLTLFAQKQIAEKKKLADYIVQFLHQADFNVTDISTNVISSPLPDEALKLLFEIEERGNNLDATDSELEHDRKQRTVKRFETTFEHTVENENGTDRKSVV